MGERGRGMRWWRAAVFFSAVTVVSLCAAVSRGDEISASGTTLPGKIVMLSAAGVAFEPAFGKGTLRIAWQEIADARSDGPFQVLFGESGKVHGRLLGMREGRLVVGTAGGAIEIDPASIYHGQPATNGEPSLQDRLRSAWRYWDGSLDLGFNLQQGATDAVGFLAAIKTRRTKGPTRLSLEAGYRYGTQKPRDQERTRNLDQVLGLARGEYDIFDGVYGYASGDAAYDGVQRLSLRAVPKAGFGYTLWERRTADGKRDFLQADGGGAWVYERFFGGEGNRSFSIAFGALAGYSLPFDTRFDWRLDYLPAADDFAGDYLLRTEGRFTLLLIDPLGLRISVIDEYDSTPADGAQNNSLLLGIGLSVAW